MENQNGSHRYNMAHAGKPHRITETTGNSVQNSTDNMEESSEKTGMISSYEEIISVKPCCQVILSGPSNFREKTSEFWIKSS